MGKKKSVHTPESALLMPKHPELAEASSSRSNIYDTHCHMMSTLSFYKSKYPDGDHATVQEFVSAYFTPEKTNTVEGLVDVYCEPPFTGWKDLADSALNDKTPWNGVSYNFVMGVHPHNAKEYTDEVEAIILEAMKHPLCVGWGEIGLDYHYDFSPREKQQEILIRQLKHAIALGKPITIHTREADDDIWRILSENVPKEQRLHIHCFTDTPELAEKLLGHFSNCFIGITGVVTYATNQNTSAVIRNLASKSTEKTSEVLRLLLETDSPYMTPNNLPVKEIGIKSARGLATCHSAMIPYTAQFVAEQAGNGWTTEEVLAVCRENAKKMYGV
ncbi:hypothetical protein P389DRAFT_197764 [Cystobasidium minutum MCA 4210]|uniref:uncharacterized protein n=1 Tax=Cystobasidium minutum MCA 4210 TaxID=1397322 RepID=UPI0034CD4C8D|eukprot:jgi/Rhomi1/197764/gm1.5978_g